VSEAESLAYDLIFGMVENVYAQTGGVNHELIGIEFEAGKPSGVNTFLVSDKHFPMITEYVERMLLKWPVVAHVAEAWAAPAGDYAPNEHPERKDIVSICLHTQTSQVVASCEVDKSTRKVVKAPLGDVVSAKGRMARSIPTKH
jgi:hypothetical protein